MEIAISILLGFTATLIFGFLIFKNRTDRWRINVLSLFCTGACGFTIYELSRYIFDQAFPNPKVFDLSLWISVGIALVVSILVGLILLRITVKK